MKLLVPVYLPFPNDDVEITDFRLNGDKIEIDFIIPNIFKGTFYGEIYFKNKSGHIENGTINGYYLVNTPKKWLWNNFEFEIDNAFSEIPNLIEEIKSGKILLEEMEYRKEIPEDCPDSFKDGYGEEIVKDIEEAYKLIGLSEKMSKVLPK